jgi:uncharacterized membrane protein YhaH (DUF805 family)
LNSPQHQAGGPPIAARLLWVFFSINGRIGREVYWLAWIVINCAVIALAFANSVQITFDPQTERMMIEPRGLSAMILVLSMPTLICVSVKRLHDMNFSGFFALALLIFPLSLVATILLGIMPGKPGPNRYGERADVPPLPPASV